MSHQLRVPSELRHLIEKRSSTDRRKKGRRTRSRRQVDLGPLGTLESAGGLDQAVFEERRAMAERRKTLDRRKRNRRAGRS